jgi:hypothetical protein
MAMVTAQLFLSASASAAAGDGLDVGQFEE